MGWRGWEAGASFSEHPFSRASPSCPPRELQERGEREIGESTSVNAVAVNNALYCAESSW